jgi:hypothetical protein
MLREIASADYGIDADAHLDALRRIRDWGEVLAPMNWEPKDVLELIRWSEPDDPGWRPGGTGIRGHIMRAFACAALLRAAAEPVNDGYFDGENQTIAQLLASALMLGHEVQEAASRFLVWRVAQLKAYEDRPFFAFALLLLAVVLNGDRFSEGTLAYLADWAVAEEAREREAVAGCLPDHGEQWLLGLTFHDQRHDVWRFLARRLVVEASKLRSEEVRAKLKDVGSRIVGVA